MLFQLWTHLTVTMETCDHFYRTMQLLPRKKLLLWQHITVTIKTLLLLWQHITVAMETFNMILTEMMVYG